MRDDEERRGFSLSAEGLAIGPATKAIDERILPGEIIGVAGLDGHGQEAFLETLAGLRPAAAGQVVIEAGGAREKVTGFKQAVARGIAYLARDRRTHGIFPSLSILDNFAIASFGRDTRLGVIDRRGQRARYAHWRGRLDIVTPDPAAPITTLSGGNQQKVLLARWLALQPRVLLLNDPTRGVDQRTREILYRTFLDLSRTEGMALVVLSTEIEEALRLCDRILVFREGEVTARLSGAELTHDGVIAAMFGRAA